MTEIEPLTSSVVSPRSRYHRSDTPKPLHLRERDLRVMELAFYLRWVRTQGLILLGHLFTPAPAPVRGKNAAKGDLTGMGHWVRRLTELWQAGVIARFKPTLSSYMPGGSSFAWTFETGKASACAKRRISRAALTQERSRDIDAEIAPLRDRVYSVLADADVPQDWIRSGVHQNTDAAMRLISGESNHVAHALLASDVLTVLWYGARRHGVELQAVLPDKELDLSFTVDHGRKTERVAIKPDAFFALGWRDAAGGLTACHGFVLEAETGTQSRSAIATKIARYLRLQSTYGVEGIAAMLGMSDLHSVRILLHCKTEAHAAMVADVISEQKPEGTGLFLISSARDIHLGCEPCGEPHKLLVSPHDNTAAVDPHTHADDSRCPWRWSRDHFIRNLEVAPGVKLYDHLASRIASPVFTRVDGRSDGAPVTRSLSLLT